MAEQLPFTSLVRVYLDVPSTHVKAFNTQLMGVKAFILIISYHHREFQNNGYLGARIKQ